MNIVRVISRKNVLSAAALIALSAIGIQLVLTPQRVSVHPDTRWSTQIQKILRVY